MMPSEGEDQQANIKQELESLWVALQGLGHDRFQLAALEARRAGESFVTMLMLGVMVAVLLIAAWLGILAGAVLALIGQGVLVSSAVLAAVAVNLMLVLFLVGVLRRKSRFLQWPACLHSLRQQSIKQPNNQSSNL